MMRAAWLAVTAFACTIWYGGQLIIAALLRLPARPGGVYDRAPVGWARRLLRWNGIRLEVEGGDRVRSAAPCVLASNHESLVDIWALLAAVPVRMRFVAKKELLRLPVFGRALRAGGHISIDRANIQHAFAAYDEAAAAIRGGLSAAVFVEGTRSTTGELLPFKKGPFVLAIRAGVPVVPVRIDGAFEVLPSGAFRVRPGTVTVRFGAPVPTAGLDYDARGELARQVRAAVEGLAPAAARGD